jgi:hypothetical protein
VANKRKSKEKPQRKAQEGHLEEGKAAKPTNGMKSGKPKLERAKKSSKPNSPPETSSP